MSASARPSAAAMPGRASRPAGAIVATAVVKDAVYYGADGAIRRAPRGEYDIVHRDGRVGFSGCADRNAFSLSLDAFVQHLHEGRIALVARRRAA